MNPGDRVRTKDGRTYIVYSVTEMHVGLIDPTRAPILTKTGQQVAHIAVKHDEVEPLPVQGVVS